MATVQHMVKLLIFRCDSMIAIACYDEEDENYEYENDAVYIATDGQRWTFNRSGRDGSLGRVQNCQSDFSAQLNTCEDKLG